MYELIDGQPGVAVLFLLQIRFFLPSYCQISTDLGKNFAHMYCCMKYTCGKT